MALVASDVLARLLHEESQFLPACQSPFVLLILIFLRLSGSCSSISSSISRIFEDSYSNILNRV